MGVGDMGEAWETSAAARADGPRLGLDKRKLGMTEVAISVTLILTLQGPIAVIAL